MKTSCARWVTRERLRDLAAAHAEPSGCAVASETLRSPALGNASAPWWIVRTEVLREVRAEAVSARCFTASGELAAEARQASAHQ